MWRLILLIIGTGAMGFGFIICAATASAMWEEYRHFSYSKMSLRNIARDAICVGGGMATMICGAYVIADVLVGWLT